MSISGWRSVILWFVLPISVISLILAFLVLPSKLNENQPAIKEPMWLGCRQTFSNKSATACLVGTMLVYAAAAITTFVISFWRYQFSITTSLGSIITMVNATAAAIGGLIAGRLINRSGRKMIIVTAGFFESVLIMLTVFVPTLSLSWGVSVLRVWCYGMVIAAFASLTLEQISKYRGTMMSLRGTFSGIGSFIGITIGGIALNIANYQAVGLILGTIGIASILVVLFLIKEPCKN